MPDRHRHDGFIWALILSLIINLLFVFTFLAQRFVEKSAGLQPFVVSLTVRQQAHPRVATAIAGPKAVRPPAKRENAAEPAATISPQSQNITPALLRRNSDEEAVSNPVPGTEMTSSKTEPTLPADATAGKNVTTTLTSETTDGLSIFEDKMVGGHYTAPEFLVGEKPPYPKRAENKGWGGTVLLNLTINANGEVEKVGIAKSSGYELLDHQARQSVGAWRFKPARRNGVAIVATVQQPIIFRPTAPGQEQ